MEFTNKIVIFCLAFFAFFASYATALECYACSNQDSNKDKCIKTTKQCEQHQDQCITRIRWGLPPYWTPYGDRMHYVDKGCTTRDQCAQAQEDVLRFCRRDWFDDWSCVECCSGDLCNYYVTLGASTTTLSLFGLFTSLIATSALKLWT